MKKMFIPLLILTLVGILMFTACKDDDKDNGGGSGSGRFPMNLLTPHTATSNDGDLLVYFFMMEGEIRSGYGTQIYPLKSSLAGQSITVKINGQQVETEYVSEMFNRHWEVANYVYTQGENYKFDITVQGNNYSVTVKFPYAVSNISFPNALQFNQDYQVDWELSQNNSHQIFQAYIAGTGANVVSHSTEISHSARTYKLPANTLSQVPDAIQAGAYLWQANYNKSGKAVAVGLTSKMRFYMGIQNEPPQKMTLDQLSEIINLIESK